MRQQLNQWAEILVAVVQNRDEAQAYALHIAKMHKPEPVTEGDGSANVECRRCQKAWPCLVIEDLQTWVEII
jgi:hypothetical protein